MFSITELCERLADAYERKGIKVRENLRPGLAEDEIRKIVSPLQIVLPDEVIELYRWRNGSIDEFDQDLYRVLSFRDNTFISLQRGVEEYQSIQATYGLDSTLHRDRVDLRACFPISSFMGSWDTVACGAHLFGNQFDHPVIRVFQGVDMYFHSIKAMLNTCIGWVSNSEWKPVQGLPDNIEMSIWTRYNPGLFPNEG